MRWINKTYTSFVLLRGVFVVEVIINSAQWLLITSFSIICLAELAAEPLLQFWWLVYLYVHCMQLYNNCIE